MLTRRLHAYVREGADENSWQSRPRHAVLSPTLGRLPPPRETAADLARVMLLLDVSTIARNVGHDLIFATSCCTHSDLGGCADSDADALPARQTTRLCCWHACASVWIVTSFRRRPRKYKHANAWWSLQLHTLCALHTASRRPALASCAATVRPVYVQVQEGRLVQLGRLAAAVLEGDVWCSTRPDLSIRPQPSEQQPAQMQEHARHARCGEDARPGGCGGSRTRVRPGHRPLLTRMHLFPLRLSAAAHIASPIYPRSRGELERQPFLFARWVLPDPTVVYHRRLHHTQRWMFLSRPHEPPCSSDFGFRNPWNLCSDYL